MSDIYHIIHGDIYGYHRIQYNRAQDGGGLCICDKRSNLNMVYKHRWNIPGIFYSLVTVVMPSLLSGQGDWFKWTRRMGNVLGYFKGRGKYTYLLCQ